MGHIRLAPISNQDVLISRPILEGHLLPVHFQRDLVVGVAVPWSIAAVANQQQAMEKGLSETEEGRTHTHMVLPVVSLLVA